MVLRISLTRLFASHKVGTRCNHENTTCNYLQLLSDLHTRMEHSYVGFSVKDLHSYTNLLRCSVYSTRYVEFRVNPTGSFNPTVRPLLYCRLLGLRGTLACYILLQ